MSDHPSRPRSVTLPPIPLPISLQQAATGPLATGPLELQGPIDNAGTTDEVVPESCSANDNAAAVDKVTKETVEQGLAPGDAESAAHEFVPETGGVKDDIVAVNRAAEEITEPDLGPGGASSSQEKVIGRLQKRKREGKQIVPPASPKKLRARAQKDPTPTTIASTTYALIYLNHTYSC